MSLIYKVTNEDVDYTNYHKECLNFSEIVARSLVDYLLNARFLRKSTFVGTAMADNKNLGYAKCCLMTGECTTVILHFLDDLICTLKAFLNKLPDARIIEVCFVATVRYLISCG